MSRHVQHEQRSGETSTSSISEEHQQRLLAGPSAAAGDADGGALTDRHHHHHHHDGSTPSASVDELHHKLNAQFRFFKPFTVLILFFSVAFFTYFDRGIMSAVGIDVKADYTITGSNTTTLTSTETSALGSAFMVGYFVTCPLFAALVCYMKPKSIILLGIFLWIIAALASGFAFNYWMLIVARCCVGIGEAAYTGYMITIVDNIAPKSKRTLWIGAFYSTIPVGNAMGIALGGIIAAKVKVSPSIGGWRVAFIAQTIPMMMLGIILSFLPKQYNNAKAGLEKAEGQGQGPAAYGADAEKKTVGFSETHGGDGEAAKGSGAEATSSLPGGSSINDASADEGHHVDENDLPAPTLFHALKHLICNPNWMCLAFGYGVYTFVLGGIIFWAISFLVTGPLHLSKVVASSLFGGIVAITGLFGSLSGGIAVDKMGGSQGHAGMYRASLFNCVMILISLPAGIVAFLMQSVALFAPCMTIAVWVLMAITAPLNAAILSSVPKNMRTYAINFSVLVMHGIGDFPSPLLAGWMADRFDDGCAQQLSPQWCVGQVEANVTATAVVNSTTTTTMPGPTTTALKVMSNVVSRLLLADDSSAATPSSLTDPPPMGNLHHCRWVLKDGTDDPYCVNIYQYRNTLVIMYAALVLTLPLWAAVVLRARKAIRDEENDQDTPLSEPVHRAGGEEVD